LERCVLDTNIWISAWLTPEGNCERLARAAENKILESLTCRTVLEEIDTVLRNKLKMPDKAIAERLRFVLGYSRLVEPAARISAVKGCEADNRILECAVKGRADIIVTGDRGHLVPLKNFQGIKILTPRQAVEMFNL
jgi:putative PIN family toxin of toxin-antitoxin system